MISDIGLSAFSGADGIHVFARSLASAEAMPGLEVRLLARNNDVLQTVRTDESGYAKFDPGLTRGEGGVSARRSSSRARRKAITASSISRARPST